MSKMSGIPFPVAACRRVHRVRYNDMRKRFVVSAVVVFQPCRVVCLLMPVLGANAVVLAFDHVAQAATGGFLPVVDGDAVV